MSEPKVGQSPTLKILIAMKVPVIKEVNASNESSKAIIR